MFYNIFIDGTPKSGKSEIAKKLAAKINMPYLSTDDLYRTLTFICIDKNVDLYDKQDILKQFNTSNLYYLEYYNNCVIHTEYLPTYRKYFYTPEVDELLQKVKNNQTIIYLANNIQKNLVSYRDIIVEGDRIPNNSYINNPKLFVIQDFTQSEKYQDNSDILKELAKSKDRVFYYLKNQMQPKLIDKSNISTDDVVNIIYDELSSTDPNRFEPRSKEPLDIYERIIK